MISRTNCNYAMILLFLVSGCKQENRENSVGFSLVSGVLIVSGRVGSVPGMFQVDTGASHTVIRQAIADKLEISISETRQGRGPGGEQFQALMAKVPSVSIGDYSVSLPSCAIVSMKNQNVPEEFLGLLGSDFMRNFAVTIDYRNQRLVFEDTRTLQTRLLSATKVPITFSDKAPNIPYVSVTINDSLNGDYAIDTGVPMTHLSYGDYQSLGLSEDDRNSNVESKSLLGGEYQTIYAEISSFAIDDSLRMTDFRIATYQDCSGLIGNDLLCNYTVTLNYSEEYVLFSQM